MYMISGPSFINLMHLFLESKVLRALARKEKKNLKEFYMD